MSDETESVDQETPMGEEVVQPVRSAVQETQTGEEVVQPEESDVQETPMGEQVVQPVESDTEAQDAPPSDTMEVEDGEIVEEEEATEVATPAAYVEPNEPLASEQPDTSPGETSEPSKPASDETSEQPETSPDATPEPPEIAPDETPDAPEQTHVSSSQETEGQSESTSSSGGLDLTDPNTSFFASTVADEFNPRMPPEAVFPMKTPNSAPDIEIPHADVVTSSPEQPTEQDASTGRRDEVANQQPPNEAPRRERRHVSTEITEITEEVAEDVTPTQPAQHTAVVAFTSQLQYCMPMTKRFFEHMANRGNQKRKRTVETDAQKPDGSDKEEERPQVIPYLTPTQEECILPDDAIEKWLLHAEKYLSGRQVSDETLLALELQFYKEYAERNHKIEKFEETIPDGWSAHPKRRKHLLDVNVPWKNPKLVPNDFPPRMTPEHLLDTLKEHPSVQHPLITKEIAGSIIAKATDNNHYCNFVLLHNGAVDPTKMAQKWLLHRIFSEIDTGEEVGTIRFRDGRRRYLNYCFHRCDTQNLSDQDISRIHNASALFLLFDDPLQLDAALESLKQILDQFDADKPAVVIFDALAPPDGLMHEDAIILMPRDEEEIDLRKKLKRVVDPTEVDIAVVPITRHLEVVTRSVFRSLCEKWKKYLSKNHIPNSKFMVKSDTEVEENYDPLEHGLEQIWRSIAVKEQPNSDAFELKMTPEEEERLQSKWDLEWKGIKGIASVLKIEDSEKLYETIERRERYLNMPRREDNEDQLSTPSARRARRSRSRSRSRSPQRSRSRSRSRSSSRTPQRSRSRSPQRSQSRSPRRSRSRSPRRSPSRSPQRRDRRLRDSTSLQQYNMDYVPGRQ